MTPAGCPGSAVQGSEPPRPPAPCAESDPPADTAGTLTSQPRPVPARSSPRVGSPQPRPQQARAGPGLPPGDECQYLSPARASDPFRAEPLSGGAMSKGPAGQRRGHEPCPQP